MGRNSSDDEVAPTIYKGPSGAIRNSNWLTNEDLPHDRDSVVTIEHVHERRGVTFKGGRKLARVFSLKFVGRDRELKVNATHMRVLNSLSGSTNCGAWDGLKILLFVEQDVSRGDGTSGPAVRIRAKRVEAAVVTPTEDPTPPTQE